MTKFFLSIAFIIATAAPCLAQPQTFSFSGERETVSGRGSSAQGTKVEFNWQGELAVGTLMGEPVVSTQFLYDLTGGVVTLPSSTARGKPSFETHGLYSLPNEAIAKIRLYDVKIRVDFESTNNDFFIESDLGYPGAEGEWAYNTPGSPDWDKLFQYPRSIPGNRHYLSEEKAKREYLKGLKPTAAYIVSGNLTLWDLHSWYESKHPKQTMDAYAAALEHVEKGLRISYGYPNSFLWDGLAPLPPTTVKEQIELIELQKEKLEKLSKIPDRFKIGDNHEPYETALKQAHQVFASMRRADKNIHSNSDQKDIRASYRPGKAPRFDNAPIDSKEDTPQPRKTSSSKSPTTKNDRIVVPKDVCFVMAWKMCGVPYSDQRSRLLVTDFHTNVPSSLCQGKDAIYNYLPQQDNEFFSQNFPSSYKKEARDIVRNFKKNLKQHHSNCSDGGMPYALTIVAPDKKENIARTCFTKEENVGTTNIALCADF